MIRAVIVDDEDHARKSLNLLIEKFVPEVKILGMADSVESAEKLISKEKPELVFLDVEMPDGTGFDLLKRLEPFTSKVIFVTGHTHYAIKAIRFAAFDYLIKPVDMDELRSTIERLPDMADDKQIDLLNGNLTQEGKLALPTMEGVIMIPHKEILYLKADGAWTEFVLTSGKKHIAARRLGQIEPMLNEAGFYRVHRTYMANVALIKRYVRGRGGYVVMENGDHLNVSESRKRGLQQILGL